MKLQKATIRPGTVVEVLENGIIKASAPGLFSFADDTTKLPPIMPWQIGSNSNSFSKPDKFDEVWIMNFTDNPQQLYWFRKDRIENCSNIGDSIINNPEERNVEVICNKNADGEWATIYFSDGSGWVIGKGKSIIQIRPNGTILIDSGFNHRAIDINPQGISIGSEGTSAHPAAYGDEVVNVLMSIVTLLKRIQIASMPNPYTMAIGTVLQTGLPMVEGKIPNIISPHVTLD